MFNITVNRNCNAIIIKPIILWYKTIWNINTEFGIIRPINRMFGESAIFALQEESEKLHNRSKLDIIYDILVYASNGGRKTHIMSCANLSSEQMNFYFTMLLSHSLLDGEKDHENKLIYKTTQKGMKFLHCCAQIKYLIAPMAKVNMQGELLFV